MTMRWTEQQEEEFLDLLEIGHTLPEIAILLKRPLQDLKKQQRYIAWIMLQGNFTIHDILLMTQIPFLDLEYMRRRLLL